MKFYNVERKIFFKQVFGSFLEDIVKQNKKKMWEWNEWFEERLDKSFLFMKRDFQHFCGFSKNWTFWSAVSFKNGHWGEENSDSKFCWLLKSKFWLLWDVFPSNFLEKSFIWTKKFLPNVLLWVQSERKIYKKKFLKKKFIEMNFLKLQNWDKKTCLKSFVKNFEIVLFGFLLFSNGNSSTQFFFRKLIFSSMFFVIFFSEKIFHCFISNYFFCVNQELAIKNYFFHSYFLTRNASREWRDFLHSKNDFYAFQRYLQFFSV